jgi:hypothetical protein
MLRVLREGMKRSPETEPDMEGSEAIVAMLLERKKLKKDL